MNEPTTRNWRKSTFSVNGSGCIELAPESGGVLLRDSKNPSEGHFTFTKTELSAFIDGCKAGEFDDLV